MGEWIKHITILSAAIINAFLWLFNPPPSDATSLSDRLPTTKPAIYKTDCPALPNMTQEIWEEVCRRLKASRQ